MTSRTRRVAKPVTVRISLKPATAQTLIRFNQSVLEAQQQLAVAQQRLQDCMRSIYSEHNIEAGRPIEVTDKAPWELVVEVTKRSNGKGG